MERIPDNIRKTFWAEFWKKHPCPKDGQKAYYEANKEKIKAYQKLYYRKKLKEKLDDIES